VVVCIDGDTKVVSHYEKFPTSFMGYYRDLAHVLKNIGSAFHNKLYYVTSTFSLFSTVFNSHTIFLDRRDYLSFGNPKKYKPFFPKNSKLSRQSSENLLEWYLIVSHIHSTCNDV
jgi:hypothetical protein